MSSEPVALLLVKFYVGCRLLLPSGMARTRAIYNIVLLRVLNSRWWPQRQHYQQHYQPWPQILGPIADHRVDQDTHDGDGHSSGTHDDGEGGIDAVD